MICESKHLSNQLALVKAAVAKRHGIGILTCVRLTCKNGAAALSATDLEIAAVVPVTTIEAPSNFDLVVPFAEFERVIKATSFDRVWIDETAEPESYVMIADGTNLGTPVSAWIDPDPGQRADDFPKLPLVEKIDQELTMMVSELDSVLAVVLPAASRDESRPVLTGIAVDVAEDNRSATFVSTDSYRLHRAIAEGVSTGERELRLAPHRFFKMVAAYARKAKRQTVTLRFGNGRCEASFDQDEGVILGRMIEGQFPKYKQLIPDRFDSVAAFDAEQLLLAIKHVDSVRKSKIEPCVLHLDKDGWHLSELDSKASVYLSKANGAHGPRSVRNRVQPEFLAGAVKAMADETVTMDFTTPLRPTLVSSKAAVDPTALLMPVRLSVPKWAPVERDVATKVTYSGKTKGAQAVTKAVNAAIDKGGEPVVEQRPTGVNSPTNQFLIEANLAMVKHYKVTDLKAGEERTVKELQRSYHNGLVAWYLGKRKTRPSAGELAPNLASVVKARVTRIGQKHGIQAPGI
jgi:DNA polymerase-3 subunit beta